MNRCSARWICTNCNTPFDDWWEFCEHNCEGKSKIEQIKELVESDTWDEAKARLLWDMIKEEPYHVSTK